MEDLCASIIQRSWKSHSKYKKILFESNIIDQLTCCVCTDIFKTFNRCVNGHGVCEFCYDSMQDNACPLCREVMSDVSEGIVCKIATQLGIYANCLTCNKKFPINNIEKHRNWCEEQQFLCPARDFCNKRLKSSELYNHLSHHDRNVVILDDIKNFIFTHISPNDNNVLILLKQSRHVIELSWSGIRSDVGRPLIAVNAKCFYPDKNSKILSITLDHYNILQNCEVPAESFSLTTVEPTFAFRESTTTTPFGIITPSTKFNSEKQVASIQILKDLKEIRLASRSYKNDITEVSKLLTRDSTRRRYMSMISTQRDIVAFVSIRIKIGTNIVSHIY
tara:strand:- start:298 stop:1299 length:1002 start_codon:yes stop_codon:yes gene_type:complete